MSHNKEYNKFAYGEISEGAKNLSKYLYEHYEKASLLLVDEYDSICLHSVFSAPSENLNNIISFTMGILNEIIKDNCYVESAFLMGIS